MSFWRHLNLPGQVGLVGYHAYSILDLCEVDAQDLTERGEKTQISQRKRKINLFGCYVYIYIYICFFYIYTHS